MNEQETLCDTVPSMRSVPYKRTLQDLVKEALDIQDACNLSGVVHAFSRTLTDLREIARAEGWEGTEAISKHPISVLYASKIASLTHCEDAHVFGKAYGDCYDLLIKTG